MDPLTPTSTGTDFGEAPLRASYRNGDSAQQAAGNPASDAYPREEPHRPPNGKQSNSSMHSAPFSAAKDPAPGPREGRVANKNGIDQIRTEPSPPRGSKALWMVVILLTVALIGVSWYGHVALSQNGIALSQLPGVQQLAKSLDGRTGALQAKLELLSAGWSGLTDHVTELDRKVSSTLQAARKQTEGLVAKAEARMQTELDNRTEAIDARLGRVESNQANANQRLAELQDEMGRQIASVRQEIAAGQQSTGQTAAGLRQQVDQNRAGLDQLDQKVTREKVGFEVAKNSNVELVSGVSLTVTHTDPSYQRLDGYLSLVDDGRTIWLRDLGAQRAFTFYTKQGAQPYDLLVTSVTKNDVVGYLLAPRGNTSAESQTAAASDSTAARPSF